MHHQEPSVHRRVYQTLFALLCPPAEVQLTVVGTYVAQHFGDCGEEGVVERERKREREREVNCIILLGSVAPWFSQALRGPYWKPATTPKAHSVSIALLAVPAGPLFFEVTMRIKPSSPQGSPQELRITLTREATVLEAR